MSQQHIRCTLSLLVSLIAAIPLTAAEAQSAESATPSAEVATADSLPELAQKLGLDEATFMQTLGDYNAA